MPKPEKWKLSEEAFTGLLRFLDADPQRAATQYQLIREKLTRFFEWRGCIPGDFLADETLDRVARRLEQGIEIQVGNSYLFIHGVAVNVARENHRARAARMQAMASAEMAQPLAFDPHEVAGTHEEEELHSRRAAHLKECLGKIPAASRDLLVAYHLDDSGGGNIERRKRLIDSLQMSGTALRLRVYRIRLQLKECLERRMRNSQ